MAFIKLQFRPGLNRDQTNYTNEGGWWACDKIRFRSGYPQKIGGWLAYTANTIVGVCRQMFGWITSFGDNMLALGTSKKVYIEVSGTFYDITPIRATMTTPDTDNCFETEDGSNVVTVNITAHGATDGSYVTFSGATAVGGVPADELNAEHVITYVDADTFTITVTTEATSTVASGGGTSIVAAFQINIGPDVTVYGYGWGAGAWGRGAWGSATNFPIVQIQRGWFFDQFDNDLVMNIRGGNLYYWARGASSDPASALGTRAVALSSLSGASDVPTQATKILVSQNDKHLIAFGTIPFGGGAFDPLLIRWANQDEPENWTPSPTNSAGFFRVSRGSQIVTAIATRQEILVWTESSLYSMQFLGTTDVFGLQELADNISIVSPRCAVSANNVTYWMGQDKFYAYSGRVETLPCTLRNHVFDNFNYDQADQTICGTNEGFHEIWWFYPSANSNTNDKYVVYNYMEKIWYYGDMARTAWLDSPLREYPQAMGYENLLFDHERGVDANGAPMEAYIQSSDFDLQDGEQFMLSRRIIPDVNFSGSTAATPEVLFAIKPRNFPGSTYQADSFDTQGVVESSVDVYTDQIFIRARARQMALRIASDQLGVNWQLGSPRLDVRQDGKR